MDWYTASVRVRYPAFSTRANHCSEWYCVHYRTDGGGVTRVEFIARIDAFLVDTGSSGGTICIHFTLNHQFRDRLLFGCTKHHWIADVSRRTSTGAIMIDDPANGCRSANIVQKAWVQTLVLNTGFGGVTVTVDITFHTFTVFVRVSYQSWWTNTS